MDLPRGCGRCVGAAAVSAWAAVHERPATHTFVNEVHFGVHATRCECGQDFVTVFTERVDYVDGFDTQIELSVAVWPAELDALGGASALGPTLTAFARGRPFLMRSTGNEPKWVASGFSIGPRG